LLEKIAENIIKFQQKSGHLMDFANER